MVFKIEHPDDVIEIPSLQCEFSNPGQCFLNVHHQIKKNGGTAIFGWYPSPLTIFNNPKLIVPFIHHCVWKSPDGQMYDITPQIISYDPILGLKTTFAETIHFLPNPDATLLQIDGKFKARPTEYLARYSDPNKRLAKAIEYLKIADKKVDEKDPTGERYWLDRVGQILGGHLDSNIQLHMNGPEFSQPFDLDD